MSTYVNMRHVLDRYWYCLQFLHLIFTFYKVYLCVIYRRKYRIFVGRQEIVPVVPPGQPFKVTVR